MVQYMVKKILLEIFEKNSGKIKKITHNLFSISQNSINIILDKKRRYGAIRKGADNGKEIW